MTHGSGLPLKVNCGALQILATSVVVEAAKAMWPLRRASLQNGQLSSECRSGRLCNIATQAIVLRSSSRNDALEIDSPLSNSREVGRDAVSKVTKNSAPSTSGLSGTHVL